MQCTRAALATTGDLVATGEAGARYRVCMLGCARTQEGRPTMPTMPKSQSEGGAGGHGYVKWAFGGAQGRENFVFPSTATGTRTLVGPTPPTTAPPSFSFRYPRFFRSDTLLPIDSVRRPATWVAKRLVSACSATCLPTRNL